VAAADWNRRRARVGLSIANCRPTRERSRLLVRLRPAHMVTKWPRLAAITKNAMLSAFGYHPDQHASDLLEGVTFD